MSRKTTKKSRTGCTTCKIRKVKCDETHPACQRCSTTGRRCDGYSTDLIIKLTHPRLVHAQTKTFVNKTRDQVQAFEFFVNRLIPGMSRIVKGSFWNRYLLQAAHSDTAVWLAINSMSELIRQIDENPRTTDGLKWYGQSLQQLQLTMKQNAIWSNVCSITAVIYICIECLMNNLTGAIGVYVRAMQALIPMGPKHNDPVHSSVMALFYHITVAHGLPLPHPPRDVSVKFSSMVEARSALEELVGPAQRVVLGIEAQRKNQAKDWQPPQETIVERDRALASLIHWKSAADILKSELTAIDEDDQLNWSSMYLAQLAYVVWLSALPQAGKEMAFDQYLDKFEMMLGHGQIIVDACGGRQTLFSFETRVLKILTLVATRCRHPLMRRRAVDLLHQGPRIENSTRAIDAVKMSRAFIAYEESGSVDEPFQERPLSMDFPPDHNRIVWAIDKRVINHDGSVSMFVSFGKWQLDAEVGWHLTREIIEL